VPVYFITLHAYRSWMPDHKRGYVRKGKGILPPDDAMARDYEARAKQPPVEFDETFQRLLLWGASDICQRRGWRLHGFGAEPTHAHFLVSWKNVRGGAKLTWKQVRGRLKNVLSWMCGRFYKQPGRRWFTDRGSRKRVLERRHFEHLLKTYLPKHRGVVWRRGEPMPKDPGLPGPGERLKNEEEKRDPGLPPGAIEPS
jgi:hypothetical protein